MQLTLPAPWLELLQDEVSKPYFKSLSSFVHQAYENGVVYPPKNQIFRAFELCSPTEVNTVILGQDPYHGPGQANGLAFSVKEGMRLPPSLKNIFKEYEADLNKPAPIYGDLSDWAKQGVLLLNATLTVEHKSPGSHQKKGWETFTDAVVRELSQYKPNLVFILWGNYAKQKVAHIDLSQHLVITSPHPSPFSAHKGFLGSRPFSKANAYLLKHKKKP